MRYAPLGEQGQRRLLASHALICGCGALGSVLANTLSAGEAQRLKLATYMSSATRGRTLFVLDEPTTGLHFSDVVQLLDCFDALLSVGHSLIVVEHNLQLMKAADYLIDLGPGAAEDGGRVVAQGTPEAVAQQEESRTGQHLAEALAEPSCETST